MLLWVKAYFFSGGLYEGLVAEAWDSEIFLRVLGQNVDIQGGLWRNF